MSIHSIETLSLSKQASAPSVLAYPGHRSGTEQRTDMAVAIEAMGTPGGTVELRAERDLAWGSAGIVRAGVPI